MTIQRGALFSFFLCMAMVRLAAQPANDSLCNATFIQIGEGCNGTTNGDNTGATLEENEPFPSCFSGAVNSVWYAFVAPSSGFVEIRTDGLPGASSLADTEIALYTLDGSDCKDLASLTEIDCNQDFGGLDQLNFSGVIERAAVGPGQVYYVQVSGYGEFGTNDAGEGSFCITIDSTSAPLPGPVNDSLCNAVELVVGQVCEGPNGDNTNATTEAGEPLPNCFQDESQSVWYSFIVPSSGLVNIFIDSDAGGTNTDTELAIYRLIQDDCSSLDNLILVDCNQDQSELVFDARLEEVALVPGERIYVQVSGYVDTEGSFCIRVEEVERVLGDEVCQAIGLQVNDTIRTFSNVGAGIQAGEEALSSQGGDCTFPYSCEDSIRITQSVWFSFVAPSTGAVQIDLCLGDSVTNFDTQIALYQTDDCGDFGQFSLLATNDNLIGCSFASQLDAFCLVGGDTYYILVDGFSSATGEFGIQLRSLETVPLRLHVTENLPTCAGFENGSLGIDVQGGVAPYSYVWQDGSTLPVLSAVKAGDYTVQITDACGVTNTQTLSLGEAKPLLVDAGGNRAICLGNQVTLGSEQTASEGSPFFPEDLFVLDANRQIMEGFLLEDPSNAREVGTIFRPYLGSDLGPLGLYTIDVESNEIVVLDSLTGAFRSLSPLFLEEGSNWGGISAIRATNQLFLVSSNGLGNNTLWEYDLVNGSFKNSVILSDGMNVPEWLAADPSGNLYAMDRQNGNLFSIDPSSGNLNLIGASGLSGFVSMDADFDPRTGKLIVGLTRNTSQLTELFEVSTSSGRAEAISTLSGVREIVGLSISGNDFTNRYRYRWLPAGDFSDPFSPNPEVGPSQSITYTLQVTDGCGTSSPIPVIVQVSRAEMSLSMEADTASGTGTATANVRNGIPPYTYAWSDGQTTETATGLTGGQYYSLRVEDQGACVLEDSIFVELIATSLDKWANFQKVNLYPNPVREEVYIDISLQKPGVVEVSILDLMGRELIKENSKIGQTHKLSIAIHDLSTGTYIVRIGNKKYAHFQRLVVER